MAKTVILEPTNYSPKSIALYSQLGSVSSAVLDGDALDKELIDAEVIVLRLAFYIDAAFLDKAPRLKIIATPTTGLNHVDVVEAEKRGIRIISLKGWREVTEKIYATSEHTIGLMLALLRRIPFAHNHVVNGGWDRNLFVGHEISGATIGLLGCGRLGYRVAEILDKMGAKVIAYDPYQTNVPACVEMVGDLRTFLGRSDIVSVHVYLTPETTHMLGAQEFAWMKPGARLINTARGQVIDETALHAVLESGHLSGAALDVLEDEAADGKFLEDNSLREYAAKHDNLILTPHIGGATRESMAMTEDAIAGAVVDALKG